MDKLDRHILLLGNTRHVHQTGRIRSGDIFGTRSHVALDLILSHSGRNGRLLDREHTAESAALILAFRLVGGNALHHIQQVDNLVEWFDVSLRWRRQAQFSHTMATVVHTHRVREFARHMIHLQYIV